MDHVHGPHSDCVSELAGGGGDICYLFFLFARLPLWLSFIARPRPRAVFERANPQYPSVEL
jgi:hypothetical protein